MVMCITVLVIVKAIHQILYFLANSSNYQIEMFFEAR